MKQIRLLRNYLIGECVLVLLLAICLWTEGGTFLEVVLFSAVQILILSGIMKDIFIPLKSFMKILNCLSKKNWEEQAQIDFPDDVPFAEQLKESMDRYAACISRENSARIFDKQTELTALQSQINPHFLYNTLECIRGQALMDQNPEIARMVEALAAFFRYSISRKGNLVTLRDELANIDNYILIQRYRFNNRFSLEVIIDEEDEEAYDYLIPRLIIQPVVENAIFHGLEEKLEGGKVSIEVIVTEKNLIITISDNGKGIDKESLEKLNTKIRSRKFSLEDGKGSNQRNTGIALPNIHKRIQLLFGEEYGVNIYSTLGQGTDVEITIPANYGRDGDKEDEKGNIEG